MNGIYKLEVWGAEGGTATTGYDSKGGYGGYSYGNLKLKKSDQLFINVGRKGVPNNNSNTTMAPAGHNSLIYQGKATQTSGAGFGLGIHAGNCGSGGGFYGGGAGGQSVGAMCAGGSSYIGNPLLTDKAMYCYNCTESNEESTKTISTTCTNASPTANCSKQGNGYARITYLGK